MFEFLFVVLGIAVGVAGAGVAKRVREAEARRQWDEFQSLAIALVDGRDASLFRMTLPYLELREVQIIGESIQLVLNTKNERTRTSRLQDIQVGLKRLDEAAWPGFEADTRDHVRERVEACRQQAIVISAHARAEKRLAAGSRATKPETRAKYLALAREELMNAQLELTDPELKAILQRAIDTMG